MAKRRSPAASPACSATIRRSRRVSCPWCEGRSADPRVQFARLTVSKSSETSEREEGLKFQPKFDASGLVTCVATDAASGEVLMVAHMNAEALSRNTERGAAWYFSHSRNAA